MRPVNAGRFVVRAKPLLKCQGSLAGFGKGFEKASRILPAGEYYVGAVTTLDLEDLLDPAFLQPIVPIAFKLTRQRRDAAAGSQTRGRLVHYHTVARA
jgi:hypothetical protein